MKLTRTANYELLRLQTVRLRSYSANAYMQSLSVYDEFQECDCRISKGENACMNIRRCGVIEDVVIADYELLFVCPAKCICTSISCAIQSL